MVFDAFCGVVLAITLGSVVAVLTARAVRAPGEWDALTALPNRRALVTQLERALSRRDPVALVVFDLSGFKAVNHDLGHDAGDELLWGVARAVEDELRAGDFLARSGGDEFAIVLVGDLTAETAERAAERFAGRLRQGVTARDRGIAVEASFGVAVFPLHATETFSLLRRADAAMSAAKRAGTGTEVYRREHELRRPERLRTITELRRGLESGEVEVFLQPQVSLSHRAVVGAEALVRWRHPERGLLAPAAFLPALAQSYALRDLTRFVLTSSARIASERPGLRVSVNVTAPDLLDPAFAGFVEHTLSANDVPADALCLEVTEDAVMSDPTRAASALTRLRSVGVRVALDDFGTGHSTLARLLDLPVDELKIDRSFVQRIAADARVLTLIRAASTMGDELGLTVVAEGIETDEEWVHVTCAGCHVGQGYLLARPLSVEAFDDWSAAFAQARFR